MQPRAQAISIAVSDLVDETSLLGHRQITDAHLLAVALMRVFSVMCSP